MAKYRLTRKVLPEITLSEFLSATGFNLTQMADFYGWPIDTLRKWSAKQGPSCERDRQHLATRLKEDLAEIKALLQDLNR